MVLKPTRSIPSTSSTPTPLSTHATHSPTPTKPPPKEIWHAFIGTGQSLGNGTGAPITLPRAAAPNALKLVDESGEYDITNFMAETLKVEGLVEPFRERGWGRYPNNIDGQTPHYNLACTLDRLRSLSNKRLASFGREACGAGEQVNIAGVVHKTVHTCVARGGAPMFEICKGGSGIEYAASIFEARALTRLAHTQGAEIIYDAIILTHGEADAILCNKDYGEQLLQMQKDYAADLMGITGQVKEPILVLSQQNTNPPVRALETTIIDCMWRVQDRSGGKVICAGPKYQYGYVDGVHLSAGGYNRLGELYGRVLHQCVEKKREFKPPRPRRATRKAKRTLKVSFEVPRPPLQWNDCLPQTHAQGAHVAWQRGRGFEVRDANGCELEIEGVRLLEEADDVEIALVVPAETVSMTVAYAMTQQGDGFGPGGFCGGTENGRMGHLCDSADDGAVESIRCVAERGSHVLVCDTGWENRATYDLVEPGGLVIVGMDPEDMKRMFLDKPWAGRSGMVEVRVRHDQRNHCVSFFMQVDELGEGVE